MDKPKIYQYRDNHSEVAEILNPTQGYRGQLERKGQKPKDHTRDNYQTIKKLQQQTQNKKVQDQVPAPEPFKLQKYKNVESVLFKTQKPKNEEQQPEVDKKEKMKLKKQQIKAQEEETKNNISQASSQKNFVKENYKNAILQEPKQLPQAEVQQFKHENQGKTPQYLEEIKKQLQAEKEKKVLEQQIQDDCPPGTKLMSEEERLETLKGLYQGRDEVLTAFNKLPITSNTPSILRRKAEYEKKLKEIESAIRTFSKPKVYIQI